MTRSLAGSRIGRVSFRSRSSVTAQSSQVKQEAMEPAPTTRCGKKKQLENRSKTASRHPSSVTPDLNKARVDQRIFKALMKHLSGTRSSSNGDVQTAAQNWLNDQGPG
ncbi:hypothetical protein TNCV_4487211 [Trichonephila clavipes]|nr:hypothetical protein TNCV_4487211 [Trichonephila clavipes]